MTENEREKCVKKWKSTIKKHCTIVGTYKSTFDPVIATLAEVLTQRDATYEEFLGAGAQPVLEYTNKAGATNLTKNPLLVLWDELNKSALSFWRDLGLTPAGLRKIDETAMKQQKRNPLAEVLSSLDP